MRPREQWCSANNNNNNNQQTKPQWNVTLGYKRKKKETFRGVDKKIIRCDGDRIRIVGHVKVAMAI